MSIFKRTQQTTAHLFADEGARVAVTDLELAAAGVVDPDRGEIVAAYVVAQPGTDPAALEAALRERAERELASYKRPRSYRFLRELPRNAMGKLDRRRLD